MNFKHNLFFVFHYYFQKTFRFKLYRTYLYTEKHCICATTLDIDIQTKIEIMLKTYYIAIFASLRIKFQLN